MRKFVGIDLAAEADRTGLAFISESAGRCVVEPVDVGADDDVITRAFVDAEKIGIDVPLGWPELFIKLIATHAVHTLAAPETTDRKWRRSLTMRATDIAVHERTGVWPLSVATERIAYAAILWAGIEANLRAKGWSVPRDGSAALVEVYPAAALRCWALQHRGYKGAKNADARSLLVDSLSMRFPKLEWNGHADHCIDDDNALDAVLAALIAYEAFCGRCVPPPDDLSSVVGHEGWIWIPQT
ncbi:DUF429 domain-containing protein [Brevibacterium sp. GP-SGM9]|uniref:DUF429 domain-containing protein n=1 Tax=Brevibacterium sp. GP-SGM9 TaxID=3376990 RepID=UPI0039A5D2A9